MLCIRVPHVPAPPLSYPLCILLRILFLPGSGPVADLEAVADTLTKNANILYKVFFTTRQRLDAAPNLTMRGNVVQTSHPTFNTAYRQALSYILFHDLILKSPSQILNSEIRSYNHSFFFQKRYFLQCQGKIQKKMYAASSRPLS